MMSEAQLIDEALKIANPEKSLPAAARAPRLTPEMVALIDRQMRKPRILWQFVASRSFWRWASEDGKNAGISAGINDAETENALFSMVSRNFREVN